MALKVVNTESLDAVADALNEAAGKSGKLVFPDEYISTAKSLSAGGGGEDLSTVLAEQEELVAELKGIIATKAGVQLESPSPKEVNFYDYDGTLLHSYTVEEAQALTELPELPTQKGLICQGWNWSLEDIKAHNRAVDVGATYITDDGKTRLYIHIAEEDRMTVPLKFTQTVANGVTIDWGDGSDVETVGRTGSISTSHTYVSVGDYVISLDVADGCTVSFGGSNVSDSILGDRNVETNMLQRVEFGAGISILNGFAFNGSYSLTSVVISNGVTSFGRCTFQNCFALPSIVIPNSVNSIGDTAFSKGYSLVSVVMPNSITSIGSNTFTACDSLPSIVIPNSVTGIGSSAFKDCHSLASVVLSNSVSSIGNSAFESCYSLKSIVIPNGVTSIGNYTFRYCQSLASIVIPNGITSIGSSSFYNCTSLVSVLIPNSVMSIANQAFYYCNGVAFYDFTNHTAVPTLSSTNAFTSIPSDCQIRVPESLVEEWKAATNWATYADQIVGV